MPWMRCQCLTERRTERPRQARACQAELTNYALVCEAGLSIAKAAFIANESIGSKSFVCFSLTILDRLLEYLNVRPVCALRASCFCIRYYCFMPVLLCLSFPCGPRMMDHG